MKKCLVILLLLSVTLSGSFASSTLLMRRQHGAQLFIDYCSGCHTLRLMPYQRMVTDLHLSKITMPQISNSSLFFQKISMPAHEAQAWFGKLPPDLSLTARSRGKTWLYHYLNGFYDDKYRPYGVNNYFIPNVAMPNVLASLKDTSEEATAIEDLVTFLVYVSEPVIIIRYHIGLIVIVFLCFLLVIVYKYYRRIF